MPKRHLQVYIAFIHLAIFIYCCPDIDECVESNGGCQHVCKNIVGSYRCLCDSGYSLGENEHSCEGNIVARSRYCMSQGEVEDCRDILLLLWYIPPLTSRINISLVFSLLKPCILLFHSIASYNKTLWSMIDCYKLLLYCIDINECSDSNGGCQHICSNTFGSYYCSCVDDYFLDDNGHSCSRKLQYTTVLETVS